MSKRVILYARLSITTEESVSIERQLQAGRDYCKAQGWSVVAEHVDDGVSASANAPELRRGWQAVLAHGKGTFGLVLVWKIDRLARKVLDFLHAHEELERRGAAIVAVSDPIDMSTGQGRAFATMLAVFAEMEADSIRVRVTAARRALIKQGRVPGGAAPFGYVNAPNPDGAGKVLAKDPETIGFVTEAIARIMRNESLGSVATYLDEVAPLTGRKNNASHRTTTVVKRLLSNPIHAGMTLFNPGNTSKERGTDVLRDEDAMPIIREDLAVMSVEEFRSLQVILNKNDTVRRDATSYLSGIVWCGDCNRKMYRNGKNIRGKHVYVFQCQGKAGCGQQVSNLESIVEEQFLSRFSRLRWERFTSVPANYDNTEINNQIAEALQMMGQDGSDVMMLAERVTTLKEKRANAVDLTYTNETQEGTAGEQWAKDKRSALLFRFAGVQLVKGRVGRKFDLERLTFIDRPHTYIDTTSVDTILAGLDREG